MLPIKEQQLLSTHMIKAARCANISEPGKEVDYLQSMLTDAISMLKEDQLHELASQTANKIQTLDLDEWKNSLPAAPEGKIRLCQERRVSAIVDERAEYLVDAKKYQGLLDDDYTPAEALIELRDSDLAVRTGYEADVDDINMIHEELVEEA